MKFALLGADPESLRLAEAALAAGHALVWMGDLGERGQQFAPLAGGDQAENWEALVDDEAADAILMGRGGAGEDLRAHQLQEFVRLGRPVLVTHPLVSSVLAYFEVDMARTESGGVLHHFNPLALPALPRDIAEWSASGHPDLGRIEQIVCTRALADRSRRQVLWHFARDVELLEIIAGRLNRIGAHAGAFHGDADYSALSVQLQGTSEIPVRWAVEPPAAAEGFTVSLICQRGRIGFTYDAADQLVDVAGAASPWSASLHDAVPTADLAIQRFVASIDPAGPAVATWPAALHAMELADSIEISLRRGRMVDVHDQQLTEQLAFKGAMSALSCGVLMLIVPLMLVVGWIAGLLGIPLAEYWPHALLALLAAFLAFQLLPKLLYHDGPPQR